MTVFGTWFHFLFPDLYWTVAYQVDMAEVIWRKFGKCERELESMGKFVCILQSYLNALII